MSTGFSPCVRLSSAIRVFPLPVKRLFVTALAIALCASTASLPAQTSAQKSPPKSRHTTVAEPDAPDADLAQAEAFIQKQNFLDAEPLLRKIVDKDPQNYVAWFDLGFALNALNRTADSIDAYRKSIAAKPDVFESNLNLGLQLAKSGDPDAEKFLRTATQLKPTSHPAEGQARAWMSLGHLLEKSKPEESLSAYQKAATLRPTDMEPHLAAGLLLESQSKFADAESEYKKALAIDPSSSDAAIGLANIYMRGRRFPDAEAELRKIVAAHPENVPARIQLGRVLAAQGKNDDAIIELQTGAKVAPNDESLQRDLADLYLTSAKYDQAESSFRALLRAHPKEAELHRSLGECLLREKKYADAQQEFLAAIQIKPDLGAAYGDLAFAANENKNYPLVIKALDARAKLLPEIPITYFLRASAFDHMREVKQASANYHLFLQTANGKYPDQEWQAKHRLIALEPKK